MNQVAKKVVSNKFREAIKNKENEIEVFLIDYAWNIIPQQIKDLWYNEDLKQYVKTKSTIRFRNNRNHFLSKEIPYVCCESIDEPAELTVLHDDLRSLRDNEKAMFNILIKTLQTLQTKTRIKQELPEIMPYFENIENEEGIDKGKLEIAKSIFK